MEKTLYNRVKLKDLSEGDKTELGVPANTGNIFLNEHLSPYNAKLAFYCRRLKKNNFINRMSTKKGVIKIEGYFGPGTENLKWKTIGHLNDLHNAFENLEEKIVLFPITIDDIEKFAMDEDDNISLMTKFKHTYKLSIMQLRTF